MKQEPTQAQSVRLRQVISTLVFVALASASASASTLAFASLV